MRVIIQNNYDDLSSWSAAYISKRINEFHPTASKPFVIGLPTGSSPLGVYKKLVQLYKEGKVSFQNVVSFNMDEYCSIPQNHEQSYYTFMWTNFFSQIDIKAENTHLLDGNAEDLEAECSAYEQKIASYGGIELFLGGVGSDGHIAFNEPGSSLASRTRPKTLNSETIKANSRFFGNDLSKVPKTALTVGVATICDAKEVLLLVSGSSKASALKHGIEKSVSHMWTISALQNHERSLIVCDEDSTSELKVKTVKYYQDLQQSYVQSNPTDCLGLQIVPCRCISKSPSVPSSQNSGTPLPWKKSETSQSSSGQMDWSVKESSQSSSGSGKKESSSGSGQTESSQSSSGSGKKESSSVSGQKESSQSSSVPNESSKKNSSTSSKSSSVKCA